MFNLHTNRNAKKKMQFVVLIGDMCWNYFLMNNDTVMVGSILEFYHHSEVARCGTMLETKAQC